MDEFVGRVQLRVLRKLPNGICANRTIRISCQHGALLFSVQMMEIRPRHTSAATTGEERAAFAAVYTVRIGITLPKHPELRRVDNVGQIPREQIEL